MAAKGDSQLPYPWLSDSSAIHDHGEVAVVYTAGVGSVPTKGGSSVEELLAPPCNISSSPHAGRGRGDKDGLLYRRGSYATCTRLTLTELEGIFLWESPADLSSLLCCISNAK